MFRNGNGLEPTVLLSLIASRDTCVSKYVGEQLIAERDIDM